MYVVAAEYKVKAGKEKEVIDILKKMIPLSRAEPGCKLYMVNQSPDDPGKLLLYEQYVEVEVSDTGLAFLRNFSGQGMEEIGVNVQDLFKSMPGFNR